MPRKKVKSARVGRCTVPPIVGRFVVISSSDAHDPLKECKGDIDGTFDTREQAEAFIRAEGRENFNLDGANEGRNEDWCSACFIAQVVAVRKAVPIVSIRVEMADAVPANPTVEGRTAKGLQT